MDYKAVLEAQIAALKDMQDSCVACFDFDTRVVDKIAISEQIRRLVADLNVYNDITSIVDTTEATGGSNNIPELPESNEPSEPTKIDLASYNDALNTFGDALSNLTAVLMETTRNLVMNVAIEKAIEYVSENYRLTPKSDTEKNS